MVPAVVQTHNTPLPSTTQSPAWKVPEAGPVVPPQMPTKRPAWVPVIPDAPRDGATTSPVNVCVVAAEVLAALLTWAAV
jgi:hypothetical protein